MRDRKKILDMIYFFKANTRFKLYKKMLKSNIVYLKEIYNFDLDHFLIKRAIFVLIVKNVIKNQKCNFQDKLCNIRNK